MEIPQTTDPDAESGNAKRGIAAVGRLPLESPPHLQPQTRSSRQNPHDPLVAEPGMIWAIEGGEAIQLRNMPLIHTTVRAVSLGNITSLPQELPAHLVKYVLNLDDRLKQLPPDAVAISTTKGNIDKRRTIELQRRIREEEYQLELYKSTKTSSKRRYKGPKTHSAPFFDASTALIAAAEAPATQHSPPEQPLEQQRQPSAKSSCPRLLMRVRVTNKSFYCEHWRNGSLYSSSRAFNTTGAAANVVVSATQPSSADQPAQPRRSSRSRTPSAKQSDTIDVHTRALIVAESIATSQVILRRFDICNCHPLRR